MNYNTLCMYSTIISLTVLAVLVLTYNSGRVFRERLYIAQLIHTLLLLLLIIIAATLPYREEERIVRLVDGEPVIRFEDNFVNLAKRFGKQFKDGEKVVILTRNQWKYGIYFDSKHFQLKETK